MIFGDRYQKMAELFDYVVDFFRLVLLVLMVGASYLALRIAVAFGR